MKRGNGKNRRWEVAAVGAVTALLLAGCAETSTSTTAATQVQASSTSAAAEETAPAAKETAAADSKDAIVTVTASVTEYADPDMAQITLGVEESEDTAEAAQKSASKKQDAVKKAITDLGISEDDISTSSYSMYPQYNYDTSKVTGYTVSVSLVIRNVTLDEVGDVLSAATSAGASQISDISYTSSSYDAVYSEALTKAAADAGTKADTLAKAEGKTLGELVSVQEGYQDTSARYQSTNAYANLESSDGADSAISVDPGQLEVDASVTAVYALK